MTTRCLDKHRTWREALAYDLADPAYFKSCVRTGSCLPRDACCLQELTEVWTSENEATCSFCRDVADIGHWRGDGRVVSEVPEHAHRQLTMALLPNTRQNRLAALATIRLQAALGPEIPVANELHNVGICGHELAMLYDAAPRIGFGALYRQPVDDILANFLCQWAVLGPLGWSHPRMLAEGAVCFSATACGWLMQWATQWTGVRSPTRWHSTRLTFQAYVAGKGYNQYTAFIWMVRLALVVHSVLDNPAWVAIFGPAAPEISLRLRATRPDSPQAIVAILTGLTLFTPTISQPTT